MTTSPTTSSRGAPAALRHRRGATLRVVVALMLREMATRYGRAPGGYAWAVLEPLGAILVLAVGFSLVLRAPPVGQSFLLFFATGLLPFALHADIANAVARSLSFSLPLLRHPSVLWIDAVLARFALNALAGLVVMVLVLTVTLALAGNHAPVAPWPAVAAAALAALLGLAVGTVNCALGGLFPVWLNVWSIINRPLFLASGVFFLFEDLPPLAQKILWFNPLVHVIGLMRTAFYPGYPATFVSVAWAAGVGLGGLLLGLLLLRRFHHDIIAAA